MIGDADLTMCWSEAEDVSGTQSRTRSIGAGSSDQSHESTVVSKSLKSLIDTVKSEAERNAIAAALEKTGWNRKAAARLLSVSYRTMLYKIEHYEMRFPETHSASFVNHEFKGNGNALKGNGKTT